MLSFEAPKIRLLHSLSIEIETMQAWLQLMKEAAEEADPSGLNCNCEAQHRYLTWRAEKELLRNFLFNGIDKLGSKSFLDYFPEYRCEDGTVNGKRSMVGKSLESRPFGIPTENSLVPYFKAYG
ncbi:hypothetical protein FNV43_RR03596 [Rhamnella rubrinervis]|uniref:Uncharacterized protein n=1 Tax=Rhamnella rubrinervis TaxID=2594499 RepID=A0A8K0HJ57_9ROSA|nr:hypothetical protein FNV43_RR03596 [Rhamnella rubrinervis]